MGARNEAVDVLRGIGIVAVVAGHAWSGTGIPPFSPYSFHMPLFFFLSGLFFDERYPGRPLKIVLKTARTLLIPTTAFFLVYAIIVQALVWGGFGGLGREFSIHDVLLNQFAGSEAYGFTSLYWFIPCLFFVRIYFSLVHSRLAALFLKIPRNRTVVTHSIFGILYLLIALTAVHESRNMYAMNDVQWGQIIPMRVALAAFFYYLGYLATIYRIDASLGNIVVILAIYIIQQQLWSTGKVLDFWMQIMKFENTFLPFITSILGISFFYGISVLIAGNRGSHMLAILGMRGMPIVLHQLFSFFLVNLALCVAGVIRPATVSGPYYEFHTERMWYVYVAAGLMLPLAIDKYIVAPVSRLITAPFRMRRTAASGGQGKQQ
ncbi:acyltransferase family protein [Paraburkholderia sacchari]|uniref:acyltransferase family protein n=1 Tax=Paraburkholderia sacchari TaxID=159450 RepID=UPI003D977518